jgi:integrase/recombinase XerD
LTPAMTHNSPLKLTAWNQKRACQGAAAITCDQDFPSADDQTSLYARLAGKVAPPITHRCAQYRGEVCAALAAAVPSVAAWATTPALPKAISPDHAQAAIDSCDLRTGVGLRDRAVLLLLAQLGLRAHEIISLRLEDCDWTGGHLRVRSKSAREQLLPMPVDVGAAIEAYLQRGRPPSQDRHVFLRSLAPIQALMPGSDAIGRIVRDALKRAGVDAPHRGSHQFRHALAVRMLQQGASLQEIGEVLRHQSPQITSIYARVDLSALRSLALPWPGGAR